MRWYWPQEMVLAAFPSVAPEAPLVLRGTLAWFRWQLAGPTGPSHPRLTWPGLGLFL